MRLDTTPASSPRKPGRQRLSPVEREKLIVDGAIEFFAEYGLSGQTRELARRLGITQPLIYRYFPTKQDLIERVVDEVFIGRWKPEWQALIANRSIPLRDRLIDFYCHYMTETLTFEWVRIYMFSGLAGGDLNRRFVALLEDALLFPLCRELRFEVFPAAAADEPIGDAELDAVWQIHAAILYYAFRKHIYKARVDPDPKAFVVDTIDRALDGTLVHLRQQYGIDEA